MINVESMLVITSFMYRNFLMYKRTRIVLGLSQRDRLAACKSGIYTDSETKGDQHGKVRD
jgi:hypothetical protein